MVLKVQIIDQRLSTGRFKVISIDYTNYFVENDSFSIAIDQLKEKIAKEIIWY